MPVTRRPGPPPTCSLSFPPPLLPSRSLSLSVSLALLRSADSAEIESLRRARVCEERESAARSLAPSRTIVLSPSLHLSRSLRHSRLLGMLSPGRMPGGARIKLLPRKRVRQYFERLLDKLGYRNALLSLNASVRNFNSNF